MCRVPGRGLLANKRTNVLTGSSRATKKKVAGQVSGDSLGCKVSEQGSPCGQCRGGPPTQGSTDPQRDTCLHPGHQGRVKGDAGPKRQGGVTTTTYPPDDRPSVTSLGPWGP